MVKIELIQTNPAVDSFQWERVFRVTHEESQISFVIETALGRTCAFNMMCGVPRYFYDKDGIPKEVVEEIRAALYKHFYEGFGNGTAPFRIGELFYCTSSKMKDYIADHFEHMFDWQSASEPLRPTSMFKFSLHPQLGDDTPTPMK